MLKIAKQRCIFAMIARRSTSCCQQAQQWHMAHQIPPNRPAGLLLRALTTGLARGDSRRGTL
tara:strand:+ start:14664 stop:14849 length:186 start_codon:yes stop_codon:yes gene_type:complete